MYLWKHTIGNLKRNATKNSIFLLIIVFILTTCSLSLFIKETASSLIQEYQTRFGVTVSIIPNAQRVLENADKEGNQAIEAPPISNEDYQAFARSNYLKDTMFTSSLFLNASQYKAVDTTNAVINQLEMEAIRKADENVRVMAYSNRDLMSEFQKHERYMKTGTIFQNALECIISTEFATLNELQVGDEIQLPISETTETFPIKISGIFVDTTTKQKSETTYTPKTNRRNEILMDYESFQIYMEANPSVASRMQITAQYYLKDPSDMEAFKEELYTKGLSRQYDVFADQTGYEVTVEPIRSMESVSENFLWIVLIGGIGLMGFLSLFMIRERKYEIGILRAIGLGKAKVMLMYVGEGILMNLIALLLSLGISAILVQPLSDGMMNAQISAIEAKYTNGNFGTNIEELSEQESKAIKEMPIQIDGEALFDSLITTLFFSFFSSMVGIVYIIRFQPIQILTQRS